MMRRTLESLRLGSRLSGLDNVCIHDASLTAIRAYASRTVAPTEEEQRSRGCSWWANPCPLVCGPILACADSQSVRKSSSDGVGQRRVGPFDVAQRQRGDLCCSGKFRLSKSCQNAPISWVTLLGIDSHHLGDRCVQSAHHAGQKIDLWAAGASFPRMDSRHADSGEPSQLGHAQSAAAAYSNKRSTIKPTQNPPRHQRVDLVLTTKRFAANRVPPPKRPLFRVAITKRAGRAMAPAVLVGAVARVWQEPVVCRCGWLQRRRDRMVSND